MDLSSLTAGHLSVIPLLNHLQVYHTHLSSLPSDLLGVVPALNTLDLTGNQLVHLPPKVFGHSSHSSLTWLDLSGNRLASISAALLLKMPHLENLEL